MANLLIKAGAKFDVIKPAGYRILDALMDLAKFSDVDLVITSGTDGEHSGPTDPHKLGEAYDVRSHHLTEEQKDYVLTGLKMALPAHQFYAFLEARGQVNEHFHIQRKRLTTYTIEDLLAG